MRNITKRDKDLLICLANGDSLKLAAKTMGNTHETCRHRSKLLRRKLGAETPAHMVALAFLYGILDSSDIKPTKDNVSYTC